MAKPAVGESAAASSPASAGPAAVCSRGRAEPSSPLAASSASTGSSRGSEAEYDG